MAAKKKDPIPSWFNPYHKPDIRWIRIPQKMINPQDEISRVAVSEGEELPIKEGAKYKLSIDTELDWGSCYYPNDHPSAKVTVELVEYSDEEVVNPSYKIELKKYNEDIARIEAWDGLKVRWDIEEAKKKEAAERRQFLKLRAKYEK